jgi:hypothetical protein
MHMQVHGGTLEHVEEQGGAWQDMDRHRRVWRLVEGLGKERKSMEGHGVGERRDMECGGAWNWKDMEKHGRVWTMEGHENIWSDMEDDGGERGTDGYKGA